MGGRGGEGLEHRPAERRRDEARQRLVKDQLDLGFLGHGFPGQRVAKRTPGGERGLTTENLAPLGVKSRAQDDTKAR